MEDFGEYNGDTVHDMWVDYTYDEYTGKLGYWDGGGGNRRPQRGRDSRSSQRQKSTSELIEGCRKRIAKNESRIAGIEADIERIKKTLESPNLTSKKIKSLKLSLEDLPKAMDGHLKAIERDKAKLIPLLKKREKERNLLTIGICIFAIILSIILFWIIYHG